MEQPELVMKFLTVLGAPLRQRIDRLGGLAWKTDPDESQRLSRRRLSQGQASKEVGLPPQVVRATKQGHDRSMAQGAGYMREVGAICLLAFCFPKLYISQSPDLPLPHGLAPSETMVSEGL